MKTRARFGWPFDESSARIFSDDGSHKPFAERSARNFVRGSPRTGETPRIPEMLIVLKEHRLE